MKIFSRISKPLLVIWLSLFSLVDFRTLSTFVLCVGRDGHVELESAINDRCVTDGQSTALGLDGLNLESEDGCGDCSDIPLLVSLTQTSSHKTLAFSDTGPDRAGVIVPIQTDLFFAGVMNKPMRLLSPKSPSNLASLRSVRLLV